MSRRVDGLLARLCAIGFAVAMTGILFGSGAKQLFWGLLLAIALFKAGRAFVSLRADFTGDRASELLAWILIACCVVVAYAAARRLAPSLVSPIRPAVGEFVLDEFSVDLLAGDEVDPDRLALLQGPPPEAGALHEWIVYGLARAEAEGCAPERTRPIKERARSPGRRLDGSGNPGDGGLYRELAALVREVDDSRRSCLQAFRACVVPLLSPGIRGTLRLEPLEDGNVLVRGETSAFVSGSRPGRFEGRLGKRAVYSGSTTTTATVQSVQGSLVPGIVPDGADIQLLFGPAGPQGLVVSRSGIPFLRARVRGVR